MKRTAVLSMVVLATLLGTAYATGPDDETFQLIDVFQLEYASDPQISPDGQHIVYVRSFMDIMKDQRRSNLWILNADGSDHRPLDVREPELSFTSLVSEWRPTTLCVERGRLFTDLLPMDGHGTNSQIDPANELAGRYCVVGRRKIHRLQHVGALRRANPSPRCPPNLKAPSGRSRRRSSESSTIASMAPAI